MNAIAWVSAAAAMSVAYLLGSIPFGLLIGKARGVDIRQTGSRNIGATNVMRCVGKSWGVLTLLLDALKGYLPAAVFAPVLLRLSLLPDAPAWLRIACGGAAIIGHNFPVYLGFKGGKGVATSAGVLLGIAPAALLIGLAVFAAVFGVSRYVSLGSLTAAVVIPFSAVLLYWRQDGPLVPVALAILGTLVIWRHKANIGRLLKGTENRIAFGSKL